MATEVINNVAENNEKEKGDKEDAPVDNGQTKEDPPAEKVEEKTEEKKVEPAPPKITVHKANFEKDVVYLYQFPRTPLLPSTSPYCLKVETWLRLAGIKYEGDLRASPKAWEDKLRAIRKATSLRFRRNHVTEVRGRVDPNANVGKWNIRDLAVQSLYVLRLDIVHPARAKYYGLRLEAERRAGQTECMSKSDEPTI